MVKVSYRVKVRVKFMIRVRVQFHLSILWIGMGRIFPQNFTSGGSIKYIGGGGGYNMCSKATNAI